MKLFSLTEAPKRRPLKKDGPVHAFGYDNWHTDKRPKILYLGKWRHPTTKNMLVGGINLNKLNAKELAIIQNKLPEIYPSDFDTSFFTTAGMKGIGSLKANYDRLKAIAPWIIDSRRYQTWDKKYIHSITVDTLKFIPIDAIDSTADKTDEKHPAYAEPEEMKKDLSGDAATQELVKKSSNPDNIKEPAKKPTGPTAPQPLKSSQKEGGQPPPAPAEAPPEPKQEQQNAAKEPELPAVPPSPSPVAFKVSSSAEDIARINQTKAVPTAGGVIKKPQTVTGNAVMPSGNKAGKDANSSLASRIKKK